MLIRIAGKLLYRLFAEIRWGANQVLESFLHPLSVSYISTETGKVTGRRPAFGKKAREWREANARRKPEIPPTVGQPNE